MLLEEKMFFFLVLLNTFSFVDIKGLVCHSRPILMLIIFRNLIYPSVYSTYVHAMFTLY